MPKATDRCQDGPISGREISEYLASTSDFGFEMRVLKQLKELGFNCRHSGTYLDPRTNKNRQYDIRAHFIIQMSDYTRSLALAVECKNVTDSAPFLATAVPSSENDAFHSVIAVQRQYLLATVVRLQTFYRVNEPVAKKIEQISCENGRLTGKDEQTFDKVSQAINGCHALLQENRCPPAASHTVILPVLVVPDDRLWQADYDLDGEIAVPPRPVKRVSLFCDQLWTALTYAAVGLDYRVSHLEIVTFAALKENIERWMKTDSLFPPSL